MDGKHFQEMESALWADRETNGDLVEHLRWCRQCQSSVDNYRWLQQEIRTTLTNRAEAVSVPQPSWRGVRGRLQTGQQKLVARWRLSAIASIVLAFCLTFGFSSLVGTGGIAYASSPGAASAPPPVAGIGPAESPTWAATPTPAWSVDAANQTLIPTLSLHPPPTAPEPPTRLP